MWKLLPISLLPPSFPPSLSPIPPPALLVAASFEEQITQSPLNQAYGNTVGNDCKSEEERQSLAIFKPSCCLPRGLTKGLSV